MTKKKLGWILTGLVFLVLLGGAYATRDRQTTGESVTAVGSTAMQPLMEAAAEQYALKHPGTNISVQGGGSGTGLSQIESGAVNMGNSDLFAQEKAGINAKNLVDHLVAVDGVAIVVNKQAGIKNLTTRQLIAVFTGQVKNWKQVGGKNLAITVINRTAGSGTRVTFERYGLKGRQSLTAQEQDSSGTVRQIVSSTPGAVSYLSFGFVNKSVTTPSLNGILPTKDNVINNTWPIWAYEHVYTKGPAKGLTKNFINYLMSSPVQETLFNNLKYIQVDQMHYSRNATGQLKRK